MSTTGGVRDRRHRLSHAIMLMMTEGMVEPDDTEAQGLFRDGGRSSKRQWA